MKRFKLLILLALLFIFGCQAEQEETTVPDETVTDTVTELIEEDLIDSNYMPNVESYQLGDLTMTIRPNESEDCEGEPLTEYLDETPLIKADPLVARIGDSLQIALNSGDTLYFMDDDEQHDNWEDYGFKYQFQGQLEGLDYWEIWVLGYEFYYTLLLDKNTGKEIETVGRSLVSPNGQYVITGNADLDAGYTENCMYLYELKENKLELKGKAEFIYWGPFEMAWIDNQTLTLKQGRFDENDYSIKYNCAEVRINKNE